MYVNANLTLKQTGVNGRSLSQKSYIRFCLRLLIYILFLTLSALLGGEVIIFGLTLHGNGGCAWQR